jgi:hypothetical protein
MVILKHEILMYVYVIINDVKARQILVNFGPAFGKYGIKCCRPSSSLLPRRVGASLYVWNAPKLKIEGQGPFSYPEPFLRALRRGALAKSITGYHKNMVK